MDMSKQGKARNESEAIPEERKQVIWIVDEQVVADDGGESIGYEFPGWYFWDECWARIHGPYPTEKDAEEKHFKYMEELCRPSAKDWFSVIRRRKSNGYENRRDCIARRVQETQCDYDEVRETVGSKWSK